MITSALASILKQIFIFSVLILPLFFGSFVDRHFYPSLHFGSNFHRMQMYRHVQLVPQSRHSYANASACACIKWRNRHHGRSKIEGRRCALPRGPSIICPNHDSTMKYKNGHSSNHRASQKMPTVPIDSKSNALSLHVPESRFYDKTPKRP